jgi:hypothetical protein
MDDMYLVVPATSTAQASKKGEAQKMHKNMKFWNVSKFARQMAAYKDTITFIIMDVDRQKTLEVPYGMDQSEMPEPRYKVPKNLPGCCYLMYSVLGGKERTVEIVPTGYNEESYCMGTWHFIEFINDAVYHKTYKFRDFIDHYRFSAYGEKYLDLKRKADIHNLQLFAPVYLQKRILAEHLKNQAD